MTERPTERSRESITGRRKPRWRAVRGFTVTEVILVALAVLIVARICGRWI